MRKLAVLLAGAATLSMPTAAAAQTVGVRAGLTAATLSSYETGDAAYWRRTARTPELWPLDDDPEIRRQLEALAAEVDGPDRIVERRELAERRAAPDSASGETMRACETDGSPRTNESEKRAGADGPPIQNNGEKDRATLENRKRRTSRTVQPGRVRKRWADARCGTRKIQITIKRPLQRREFGKRRQRAPCDPTESRNANEPLGTNRKNSETAETAGVWGECQEFCVGIRADFAKMRTRRDRDDRRSR